VSVPPPGLRDSNTLGHGDRARVGAGCFKVDPADCASRRGFRRREPAHHCLKSRGRLAAGRRAVVPRRPGCSRRTQSRSAAARQGLKRSRPRAWARRGPLRQRTDAGSRCDRAAGVAPPLVPAPRRIPQPGPACSGPVSLPTGVLGLGFLTQPRARGEVRFSAAVRAPRAVGESRSRSTEVTPRASPT